MLGASLSAAPLAPAAVVMRDRATMRPRGFGFVTFKDKAVADRVVQDIHVIDGRQVRQQAGPGLAGVVRPVCGPPCAAT